MKLGIGLATRGRPERLVENVNMSLVHWTNPNTTLWIMADKDDPETAVAFKKQKWPKNVRLSVREREDTVAAKWNRLLDVSDADVYLIQADDCPHLTPAYDQKILDAAKRLPDGIGFIWGHLANASFTCAEAMTRKTALKLGFFFPEYFPYWFVDHWLDDIARITDRISFADIRTDEGRPGKTQEMREPGWWATFFDAGYLMRRKQAHALINDPEFVCEPWRKEMLLAHHPLIEYRSRWINDQVRANSQMFEQWSNLSKADARYQRVKDKAIAMLPGMLEGMSQAEADSFRRVLVPPTTIPNLLRCA